MTIFLKRFLPALFFATMLAYILAGIWQNQPWQLVTKPLLMPLLMWWVWLKAVPTKNRTLILVALFFSFAGDVFLLLEYKEPFLFIPGLVSFLLTHILYIVYFLWLPGSRKTLLKTAPYIGLLVIAYGFALVYFLYPSLGALKIPVLIYAIIIMSMLLASIHIYYRVSKRTALLFIAGACFFVLSDSMLAFNKFQSPLIFPFLIMLTYCLAQFLIVKGFLLNTTSR